MNNFFKTVLIGGFQTIVATRNELAELMVVDCLKYRSAEKHPLPKLVFSSNGQGISLAATNKEFRVAMERADIIHADGMSVVMASRLLTPATPLPERIATTDFFHNAAQAAQNNKLSFFILGGTEEQNSGACRKIKELYPHLKIAGRRNGYFKDESNEAICEEIVKSGADVLWVAFGKPKQELWAAQNRKNLTGICWIKTCGGLYSFLSGESLRAPHWMQLMGLEWLFRALHQPRLLWRYLITNPHAIYRIIVNSHS